LLHDEGARHALQRSVVDSIIDAAGVRPQAQSRLVPPSTRAYVVDRAVSFIDSRLCNPISIADVCAEVRVCPRTLAYSFAEVLGVSPSRYLLATRLSRVRRELASSGPHAAISSVATRWGFWHMGRFAQYYRRAFGERPSETCRSGGTVRPSRAMRISSTLPPSQISKSAGA
jgi:AraC family ethanolamine operon transcriptional activator